MTGKKDDSEKLRWDLLPIQPLISVVERYTHGAEKYGPNNWQSVENPTERYYAALMRHLMAWRSGETIDEESGLSHLSAVIWNALTLEWFDIFVKRDKRLSDIGICICSTCFYYKQDIKQCRWSLKVRAKNTSCYAYKSLSEEVKAKCATCDYYEHPNAWCTLDNAIKSSINCCDAYTICK